MDIWQVFLFTSILLPVLLCMLAVKSNQRSRFLMPWHVVITLSLANLLLLPILLIYLTAKALIDSSVDLALWLGFILPMGSVSLTVLCSTVLGLLPIGSGTASQAQDNLTDPDIKTVMRETRGLLRGSARYSHWRVRALFSDGPGPAISLRQSRGKELEVVFRFPFLAAIAPERPGMLIRSELRLAYIRAVVFHEIGHFLNSDYPIIRIALVVARSYALAGIAAGVSLSIALLAAILGLWPTFPWLGMSIAILLPLVGLLLVHIWVWRQASVDQENKADLRMLRSLTARDRDLLFVTRRGCPRWRALLSALVCIDGTRVLSPQNVKRRLGSAQHVALRYWQGIRQLLAGTPWLFKERNDPLFKEVEAMRSGRLGPLSTPPSMASLQRVGFVVGAEASVLWIGAMLLAKNIWGLWGWEVAAATPLALIYGSLFVITPVYLFMALCIRGRTRLKTDSSRRFRRFLQLACAVILGCIAVFFVLLVLQQLVAWLQGGEAPSFAPILRGIVIIATVYIGGGCFIAWLVGESGPEDFTLRGVGLSSVLDWSIVFAILLIGPGLSSALWFSCGLFDTLGSSYGIGGLLFGVFPFLLTFLLPDRVLKVFPFGPELSAGSVRGMRVFWRNWYTDTVRGITATQVIATSVLIGLGISLYSAVAALFAILLRAVVDDWIVPMVQLMLVVSLGFVVLLVIPVIRRPRRIQAFSPANLHLMFQMASACNAGLGLNELGPSVLKERINSLSLLFQYPIDVAHKVMADDGPKWLLTATLLVRLGRELGCDAAVGELAPLFRARLLTHLTPGGVVSAWPGGPPSLLWTAWAADLCMTLSIKMPAWYCHPLDSLGGLIEDQFAPPSTRNPIRLGWWRRQMADGIDVLRRYRPTSDIRRWAAAVVDGVALDGRACKGLWMSELVDLSRSVGAVEIEEAIILRNRARAWEVLQANPDKQLGLLLDCWQVDRKTVSEKEGGLSAALEQALVSALIRFVDEDLPIPTDS